MIPKISVIIPVYNVAKYLHRCIDSALAQTFTDFELLLIDDGSKDNSGEICDEYARKDNRVRVFHKENEGVSVARNIGIGHSSGTYLMFLDSDDWLESSCLDYCLKSMKDDNLDFLQFGYARVTDDGNVLYKFCFYSNIEQVRICEIGQFQCLRMGGSFQNVHYP